MQWNFTLWADLFQWKFFSLMKNVVQLYCLSSLQIETLSQQYSNPRMPPVICCLCSNVSAFSLCICGVGKWNWAQRNLDKCWALFKTWLLVVAQDLWWDKKARKSIYASRHWFTTSRSSSSKEVLQVAKMCQARTVDLCHVWTQETRILNRTFFDLTVCEKTAMRLDMNLKKPNQVLHIHT